MIIATTENIAGHRVVTTLGQVFGVVVRRLREKPGGGWVKTAERFVDPDSGKTMDVLYNPSSGERRYVAQEPEKKS